MVEKMKGETGKKKKDERGIIRPTPGRGVWQVKGRMEGKQGGERWMDGGGDVGAKV